MPYQQVTPGQEALASYVNTYLMNQAVSTFSSASARSAAITTPIKGQCSTRDDSPGIIEIWDGTAWVATGGSWTTYTPTWSTTGTAPALGNGTLVGAYCLIGAKTCVVQILLTCGTTTVAGTGDMKWALPFTANGSYYPLSGFAGTSDGAQWAGVGSFVDSGVRVALKLPQAGARSDVGNARSRDASNAVGTGLPAVPTKGSFDAFGQVALQGVYRLA